LSNFENNENMQPIYEDISSHSPSPVKDSAKKAVKATKKAADNYGNSAFKNIDKVIKIIAFIVSLTTLLIFGAGAAIVYFMDKSLILICALILFVGVATSLISLFLIFGFGHIISQNKAILKKLDE